MKTKRNKLAFEPIQLEMSKFLVMRTFMWEEWDKKLQGSGDDQF